MLQTLSSSRMRVFGGEQAADEREPPACFSHEDSEKGLLVTADCAYRSHRLTHATLLYHSQHDRSRELKLNLLDPRPLRAPEQLRGNPAAAPRPPASLRIAPYRSKVILLTTFRSPRNEQNTAEHRIQKLGFCSSTTRYLALFFFLFLMLKKDCQADATLSRALRPRPRSTVRSPPRPRPAARHPAGRTITRHTAPPCQGARGASRARPADLHPSQ